MTQADASNSPCAASVKARALHSAMTAHARLDADMARAARDGVTQPTAPLRHLADEIESILRAASFAEAQSGEGAHFLVCLASAEAQALSVATGAEAKRAARALHRCLWGVRLWLEAGGNTVDGDLADYLMSARLAPKGAAQ